MDESLTAFSKTFKSTSFDLRPGASRDEEACLWLTFSPVGEGLNLAARDYALREDTHVFEGKEPEDVAPFLASVEAAYDVTLPAELRALLELYLKLAKDSFSVSVELTEGAECEFCGWNPGTSLAGFYFPAITADGEASLAVRNGGGCFGGELVAGTPEATSKEALELIDYVLGAATRAPERSEAAAFRAKLENVLKVS